MSAPEITREVESFSGDLLVGLRVPARWLVQQRWPRLRLAVFFVKVLFRSLKDEWFWRRG